MFTLNLATKTEGVLCTQFYLEKGAKNYKSSLTIFGVGKVRFADKTPLAILVAYFWGMVVWVVPMGSGGGGVVVKKGNNDKIKSGPYLDPIHTFLTR